MGPALLLIAQLYRVEKQARPLAAEGRLRQLHSRPILDKLRDYLEEIHWRSIIMPPSAPSAVSRLVATTGYSLAATKAATRLPSCGAVWRLASEPAGDPFAWFKGVLSRIAAHPITRIAELLPHNWAPAQA